MKVLFINRNYLTTALHQTMIEHFEQLGISCDVFAPAAKEDQAVIKPNKNVTMCICYSKWERPFYRIKQSRIMRTILNTYSLKDYDLIHASTVFTDGNAAYQLNKKFGVPYIVAFRDTDMTFFRIRFDLKKRGLNILLHSSAIIFLSERLLEDFLDLYIPANLQNDIRNKSRVIPNGIDDFWLDNKSNHNLNRSLERIENKVLHIVYAGRITKNKNLELTQDALEILRSNGWNCSFTVIGKVFDDQVLADIMKYGHTKYVEPQKKEQLITYYRDADVFVMPSHHETFGLVYAEAMSQGLPVIYTRGQGFDGQFEEGVVGYSVSNTDSSELSEKLIMVTNNYLSLSQNAFALVDRFRWEHICKEYINLFTTLIQKQHK